MRFLLELDGVLFDPAPVYYQVYRDAAAAVGWARIDQPTFWRLYRAQGADANVLPGAKPLKIKQYQAEFDARLEKDETIAACKLHSGAEAALAALLRFGSIVAITLGSNLSARRKLLESHRLSRVMASFEAARRPEASSTFDTPRGLKPAAHQIIAGLSPDPRRRPAELKTLAAADPRALVVAATDTLLRSADAADLFTVGIGSGACTVARLHRVGATVVYDELTELANSLRARRT